MTVSVDHPHLAVLGAGGLLGAELVRFAKVRGWDVTPARSADVDARSEPAVLTWLLASRPDVLVLCAARNAGVHANIAAPADMLVENAQIALGAIAAARRAGVRRLLFCGSTAIYSESAVQPYREPDAGVGPLEPSHMGYSSAKLMGLRLCQAIRAQDGLDYSALLLSNIYGPGQNYDPGRANVTASLLARFHEASASGANEVGVWGTGAAMRDLIFVRDAASAILLLAGESGPSDGAINVASGQDITIRSLAEEVARVTGYRGQLVFDPSKPEGARRRSVDISRLTALGWSPATSLGDGLSETYRSYLTPPA